MNIHDILYFSDKVNSNFPDILNYDILNYNNIRKNTYDILYNEE